MLLDFAEAALGEQLRILAGFFLGYGVILATPGPNMLAIGGIAALHGFRGALPICFGIAAGAGALSAALLLLASLSEAAGMQGWDMAGRILGALLLLYVALTIARLEPPEPKAGAEHRRGKAHGGAAFGAGFCTAAANPLTGAFFTAQFIGPLRITQGGMIAAITLLGVVAMALGFFLLVAALLAQPSARRAAVAWHRPIRLLAALALAFSAVAVLCPVLSG